MLLSGRRPLQQRASLRAVVSTAIAVACTTVVQFGRANSLVVSKNMDRVRQAGSSLRARRCCWYNSTSTTTTSSSSSSTCRDHHHDALLLPSLLLFRSSTPSALVDGGGGDRLARSLSFFVGFRALSSSPLHRASSSPAVFSAAAGGAVVGRRRYRGSQALWEKAMMLVPPSIISKVN